MTKTDDFAERVRHAMTLMDELGIPDETGSVRARYLLAERGYRIPYRVLQQACWWTKNP